VNKKVRTYLIIVTAILFFYLPLVAQVASPAGSSTPSLGTLLQQQSTSENPLLGSRPAPSQPGVISLTLLDALDRGLKYNLGIVLSERGTESATAARLRAMSEMLPHVSAHVAESVQQINLAAYGFPVSPGASSVIGPFSVFDTRAALTDNLFDLHYLYNKRAADENVKGAKFSYQNTRDLVVLVVGASYLQTLADAARVESAQAQVQTSKALYDQAVNLKSAGMVAGIDVLRSQVEYQAQQQRLLVAQNELDKQMLSLARTIGIPMGQQIKLADKIPAAQAVPITFEDALKRAYEKRSDYQQAESRLRAAELVKKSAEAQRLPSVGVNGDYGVIGRTPGNSHGTFTAAAALQIPIFQGGRITADVQQAEVQRKTREAELDDLRQRIEFEVRSAFLDVNAATKQLEVATSALGVARDQVSQSRDRFAAGVSNNVEVVQAQEQLAAAEENYISSLFAHNVAKLSLARALGIAEDATKKFLGGQ
jgi:outer membrane protein TolC